MWLDTFNQMRKESGMSLDELCAKSGVPKGTLTKISSGVTKSPSLETMKTLVYAMGYTLKDLDDGLETSDNFSKEERTHIQKYRLLDQYGKEAVDSILAIEYRRHIDTVRTQANLQTMQYQMDPGGESNPRMVEKLVYINPAAAGTPLYAESDFERLEFPEEQVPNSADFGIRIAGKSMEPTVKDGAIVWVHKTLELANSAVGVFMINDSAVCKRFFKNEDGSIHLESDNPDFDPVEILEADTFMIVGEVVGTV